MKTWHYVWFYTFSLLGLILCTGLLGLIAAHKIRRSGYVINLITGAAVQCFTFTLMLFAGMPRVDQQPNHALNTLSAALALSANTLVSTAAMVLCISVAINVVGAVRKTGTSNIFSSNWLMFSGLALPWLVFVSIALASIILSVLHPDTVARKTFYSTTSIDGIIWVSVVDGGGSAAISFVATLISTIMLVRHRKGKLSSSGTLQVAPILRIVAVGVFTTYCACVGLGYMSDYSALEPDLGYCTLGVYVFLVFGLQADVLQALGLRSSASHSSLSRGVIVSRRTEIDITAPKSATAFDSSEQGFQASIIRGSTFYVKGFDEDVKDSVELAERKD